MAEQLCNQHSAVVTRLDQHGEELAGMRARLETHCNGGGQHVSRREVDALAREFDTACQRVEKLREQFTEYRLSWQDRLLLALVNLLGIVGSLAVAHLAR